MKKPQNTRGRQKRSFAALLTTASVIALSIFAAVPAQAHDQLLSSTPGDGESVATTPGELTLTFSDTLMGVGSIVRVSDSTGTKWGDGELSINGAVLTQPLLTEAALANETYTVDWQVVSSDGHPISGTFSYTVGEGATVSAPPTASATAASDAASAIDEAEVQNAVPSLIRTLVIALLGAAAAIGLCALIIAGVRRLRRSAADDDENPSEQTPSDSSTH